MSDVRVEWNGDKAADKLQRVVEEMLFVVQFRADGTEAGIYESGLLRRMAAFHE